MNVLASSAPCEREIKDPTAITFALNTPLRIHFLQPLALPADNHFDPSDLLQETLFQNGNVFPGSAGRFLEKERREQGMDVDASYCFVWFYAPADLAQRTGNHDKTVVSSSIAAGSTLDLTGMEGIRLADAYADWQISFGNMWDQVKRAKDTANENKIFANGYPKDGNPIDLVHCEFGEGSKYRDGGNLTVKDLFSAFPEGSVKITELRNDCH